jgi:tetratricopeptide (TPR) repeat protein
MIALLLVLALATPEADVKRARDRYEFGAYADAAGAARDLLARTPNLPEPVAVEAWRILGLAEYQLGDLPAAREAFIHLLSIDPDQTLDPFLVPPPIVEFFDKIRSGPPSKVILVQEHVYMLNFLPFGVGQFQNGDTTKGIVIAVSQVVLGAINLGAILAHNAIADDPSRRCLVSTPTNCSNPPIPDSDRALLQNIDIVKYVSAGLFWGVYAYGVVDSLANYVPRIETEITPGRTAVKLSWVF